MASITVIHYIFEDIKHDQLKMENKKTNEFVAVMHTDFHAKIILY